MEILYKNFLKEKNVYRPNIAYWHKQIKRMLEVSSLAYKNEKYLADRFSNGDLFFDGNPIFNMVFEGSNKALRIIQENPEEFEEYYTSFKADIIINDVSYEELVIVLTLSKGRREKALLEIQEWIKG